MTSTDRENIWKHREKFATSLQQIYQGECENVDVLIAAEVACRESLIKFLEYGMKVKTGSLTFKKDLQDAAKDRAKERAKHEKEQKQQQPEEVEKKANAEALKKNEPRVLQLADRAVNVIESGQVGEVSASEPGGINLSEKAKAALGHAEFGKFAKWFATQASGEKDFKRDGAIAAALEMPDDQGEAIANAILDEAKDHFPAGAKMIDAESDVGKSLGGWRAVLSLHKEKKHAVQMSHGGVPQLVILLPSGGHACVISSDPKTLPLPKVEGADGKAKEEPHTGDSLRAGLLTTQTAKFMRMKPFQALFLPTGYVARFSAIGQNAVFLKVHGIPDQKEDTAGTERMKMMVHLLEDEKDLATAVCKNMAAP